MNLNKDIGIVPGRAPYSTRGVSGRAPGRYRKGDRGGMVPLVVPVFSYIPFIIFSFLDNPCCKNKPGKEDKEPTAVTKWGECGVLYIDILARNIFLNVGLNCTLHYQKI